MTLAIVGVTAALLVLPALASGKGVEGKKTTDIIKDFIKERRLEQHRDHIMRKAPAIKRKAKLKARVKAEVKRAKTFAKEMTKKKAKGTDDKAKGSDHLKDPVMVKASRGMMRLTILKDRVKSFSKVVRQKFVDAKKVAGQAAYAEFQKTKKEVALKLLEGIQEDLEQASAVWGELSPAT